MEIKSRRCTFLTRPGIVEGSEGGGTKRGNSRRRNGVGGGIQDTLVCCENGGFEGEGGYVVRGERGYWSRR